MKNSPKPKASPKIPEFRSESEEAAWWDANEDFIVERLKSLGYENLYIPRRKDFDLTVERMSSGCIAKHDPT